MSDPSATSETPRRILFVINSMTGGGAERVMSTLLRASEHHGKSCEIHLALLDEQPLAYDIPGWVVVHRLDCGFGLCKSVSRTISLVARLKPSVSLSFLTRSNIANIVACRLNHTVAVISERVDTGVHLGSGVAGTIGKWLVRRSYRRADRVIAVSGGVADGLRRHFGVTADRIEVIANPIDGPTIRARALQPPAFLPPGNFTAAMGRLVENKNFPLLIRAFAKSDISEHLVILGEGPERPALLALAARLGIGDRFHLPGFSANPFAIVRHADLFVLCSNAEGFPNALVEAMALGLPVVATNCPSGPSEILAARARSDIPGYTEAEHGILVRPGAEDDMIRALRAMRHPCLNRRYRHRAAERAAAYSVDAAARRYWSVLSRQAARQPAPSSRSQAHQTPGLYPSLSDPP